MFGIKGANNMQSLSLHAIFNFFRYLFFVFGSNTFCICNRTEIVGSMYLLYSWFLFDFMTPKSLCAGMYSKV